MPAKAATAPPERDHGVVPFGYFRGKPLRIGNEAQLLADDYVVERLGGRTSQVVWASPSEAPLARNETVQAELVFEVPDKALELTLAGAGDVRLSMGTEHHSGGRGR